jgi:GT2 family glycosyltransferase
MPKYSIIIPTLTKDEDHLHVLQECMESIKKNSKDYELILVDDGSTWQTWEDFDAWDNFVEFDILIQHTKNKGIASSWNDGIKIARGEYIAIVNDDITVQEGWLDKLRMALEEDDDNMVSAPGLLHPDANASGIIEDYQWYPGYCFMLKRETIDKIGLFDEQFSPFNFEDTDYWTRVLSWGGKLVRNYNTNITHREGHVLHTLEYEKVSEENKKKFIEKHGFDPIPVFYYGAPAPWII